MKRYIRRAEARRIFCYSVELLYYILANTPVASFELVDELIQLVGLGMHVGPVMGIVPLLVDLLVGLALLLYPGVVLEVVYALAVLDQDSSSMLSVRTPWRCSL